MKNKTLIAIVIGLILLAACAKEQAAPTPAPAPEPATPVPAPVPAPVPDQPAPAPIPAPETLVSPVQPVPEPVPVEKPAVSFEVTQETQAKLDAVFTKGTKVAVSEPARKMKQGEVYVFAIGVRNLLQDTDTFKMSWRLLDAIDRGNNYINDAPAITTKWLENAKDFSFDLAPAGSKILPFIIDLRTAAPTGSYTFEITVKRKGSLYDIIEDYDEKKITVIVG
ncbi:hypothetical protein HY642_03355 [Candidatus Woesearchaeota archaeon]|nr:hypothetical protein [Candidatus Woesearchaeota archaeon]